MNWTDIFIRRPVLSLVVSALVLVFGLKAIGSLPVNQYPQTISTDAERDCDDHDSIITMALTQKQLLALLRSL